jgi:hypothetical protein
MTPRAALRWPKNERAWRRTGVTFGTRRSNRGQTWLSGSIASSGVQSACSIKWPTSIQPLRHSSTPRSTYGARRRRTRGLRPEDGPMIIGTGRYGNVKLSEEAEGYFREKGCSVELFPTPEALKAWNRAEGRTIGMFHVTC